MDIADAIKAQDDAIVVVDDEFLPANLSTIGAEAYTAMFQSIAENDAQLEQFKLALGSKEDNPAILMEKVLPGQLQRLWDAYDAGKEQELLGPLLSDFAMRRRTNRSRVDSLVQILRAMYGVEPRTFGTLEEAKPYLAGCVLAFIDFYLSDVNSPEEAHAKHRLAKDELSAKFSYDAKAWPKLVILVSSALPNHRGLATFRSVTGIKSAFFQTLDKNNIQNAFVESTLKRCMEQYLAATKLNAYLEVVQASVMEVAKELNDEVSKLELHDLTTLKSLRLDAESESVQAYVTWLLSEAMAAKLRSSAPLQQPTLPAESDFAVLDGKLLPGSVLFELFSDIAIAPLPTTEGPPHIAFGDVLEKIQAAGGDGVRRLVLAISPACDLVRCPIDYEVLCVHGTLLDSSPSLQELLSKAYQFGKGHLVLKHTEGGEQQFSRIKWEAKKFSTIPASQLQTATAFKRMARLSEIFTQEVKELVLSHVARVGTPIDPSFSIAVQALVRIKINVGPGQPAIEYASNSDAFDFVSGVLAMGREASTEGDVESESKSLEKTVIFSRQFRLWLQGELETLQAKHNHARLKALVDYFAVAENFRVALSGESFSALGGKLKIAYSANVPTGVAKDFELLLYPYNRDSPVKPATAAIAPDDGAGAEGPSGKLIG